MKNLTAFLALLSTITAYSAVGRTSAVEAFLDSEFQTVLRYGTFWDLPATQKCDEMISVYVQGNRGSGNTSYDCTICLVNDGGVMSVEADYSECVRESH